MQDNNHLTVPGPSATSPPSSGTGRPRSGSQRSQRSQRSQDSQPQRSPEVTDYGRRPSIRIRRFPSSQALNPSYGQASTSGSQAIEGRQVGRNRSTSEPQRWDFATEAQRPVTPGLATRQSYMPNVAEETISPTTGTAQDAILPTPEANAEESQSSGGPSRPLRRARTNIGERAPTPPKNEDDDEYESNLVDMLDLIDPEVQTLQTLTNVQNSLFVPDLGRYLNRRPTYTLTRRPSDIESDSSSTDDVDDARTMRTAASRLEPQRTPTSATLNTITSRVNDKYFAVLPHGVRLPGWSEEDKLELNDHVRHMLHSRRSKFKRSMKGFGQYVQKPLGLFVTVYATLITLFGLAWVLFLIGWINVGNRKSYLVNVIDNVLVALFAIIGDGLAPFRTVDTYHMCFIAHYHHLSWRLRKEKALPKLHDHNDLPAVQEKGLEDPEAQEFSVLSPEQQKRLEHHQKKFSKSHSFYRSHETTTHHAFPLRLLVAIVVLLDCHSLLQIALGTCTWAISYHVRPFALTTVILCCSITCNITAGILISVGDKKTRKKDVIEKMFRQELTCEAMRKVEKKRRKERANLGLEDDPPEAENGEAGAGAVTHTTTEEADDGVIR